MHDPILNHLIVKPFSDTPTREYYVAATIELSIDNIYLAMYARRLNRESTKHIHRIICSNNSFIRKIRVRYDLYIEKDTLDKLHRLAQHIITSDNHIDRIIPNATPILDLIHRLSGDQDFAEITDYIHMVLATAGQYQRKMVGVLPSFVVGEHHYLKSIKRFDTFELMFDKGLSHTPGSVWYNIFTAMRFTIEDPFESFTEICATLYIDILPSVSTGVGITTFSLLQFLGNKITQEYVVENNLNLFDKGVIEYNLEISNGMIYWLSDNIQMTQTPAIEAVDSDQEEGGDLQPDTGKQEAGSPEPTEDEGADKQSEETPEPEAGGSEPDEGTSEPEEGSGDMSTPDNPPDEGGDDNTIEAKPMIFGLELKLAKNETLDDYLYKLSIANTISTILELNHDDLPPRTLTMLRDWKNMYLFLVASEETKRFLKQLKIKS